VLETELVTEFIRRGVIIERDALELLRSGKIAAERVAALEVRPGSILTRDILLDSLKPVLEKQNRSQTATGPESDAFAKVIPKVIVEKSFKAVQKKASDSGLEAFVGVFRSRYEKLRSILQSRPEMRNCVSVGRLKEDARDVAAIGIVSSVTKAKSGNTVIELEDQSGRIKVIARSDKDLGQEKIMLDSVIGVKGSVAKGFLFADAIYLPDIPIPQKIAATSSVERAAFISDLHFGSEYFIKEIADRFLEWINSGAARDVNYLLLAGDLVDGVGVYPGQESNLVLKDIHAQYKALEEFLLKIPSRIQVVISPGNHDVSSSAEPQPPIPEEFLPRASRLPNMHFVSNPAWLRIGARGEISVLIYHGDPLPVIVDSLPHLRQKGIAEPNHVMRELLKARHLSPLYGATTIAPEEEDWLVIDRVPDIFHVGNLHTYAVDNYKGVTLVCSSTWQAQTPFMDRMGLTADPGKVAVLDLSTRKVETLNFLPGVPEN